MRWSSRLISHSNEALLEVHESSQVEHEHHLKSEARWYIVTYATPDTTACVLPISHTFRYLNLLCFIVCWHGVEHNYCFYHVYYLIVGKYQAFFFSLNNFPLSSVLPFPFLSICSVFTTSPWNFNTGRQLDPNLAGHFSIHIYGLILPAIHSLLHFLIYILLYSFTSLY